MSRSRQSNETARVERRIQASSCVATAATTSALIHSQRVVSLKRQPGVARAKPKRVHTHTNTDGDAAGTHERLIHMNLNGSPAVYFTPREVIKDGFKGIKQK